MRDVWEEVVSAFISLLDAAAGQDSVIVIRAPFGKQVCCVASLTYYGARGLPFYLSHDSLDNSQGRDRRMLIFAAGRI